LLKPPAFFVKTARLCFLAARHWRTSGTEPGHFIFVFLRPDPVEMLARRSGSRTPSEGIIRILVVNAFFCGASFLEMHHNHKKPGRELAAKSEARSP
jgi:hypothetical protein